MTADLFDTQYPIERLPSDGSLLDYGLQYTMSESQIIMDKLLAKIPWQSDTAYIYGKHITTKRKVAWFGDGDFNYNYSNSTRRALPWTKLLLDLKLKISEGSQHEYNSVLLNLYHDGSEGMGWHSDDEKELGQAPTIASLSFGAIRRFDMRHKETGQTISQALEPGGLIVMSGQSQACWKHQVPKQLRVKEPRINLTFRYFYG
jgi:alkylated DNA repair dioxygenase AlkB